MLEYLLIGTDIRNICVFLAPVFSGFTAIATYLFTKEITHKSGPGLLAALFIAIVPSYISRSVAGFHIPSFTHQ
jgi:dolichyl-diphosphooligosaccharide---protein glycosyltransferase